MCSASWASTATAPGWLTISRSTSSPSAWRNRSLRTLAIRPLQMCSVPTRSKDTDFLRKDRAACQSRPEKQLVLVDSAPHGGGGKARATIEIEVDGGADSLMATRQRLMLGQRHVNGLQQELEHGLRVVAEALMAFARVARGHPRDDQRLEPQRQCRMRGFQSRHAAVAKPGV